MVVAFDLDRLEPVGAASVLEQDIVIIGSVSKHYAVSDYGTLAFIPDSGREPSLVRVNHAGEVMHSVDRVSSHPSVSPVDGRVAYVCTETGRAEVYVESFPALDERIAVSSGGGVEPVWSRDGEALVYRTGLTFLRARIVTKPTLRAEPPEVLFDTTNSASNTHAHHAITDGGLVMRQEREPLDLQRINIVTNSSIASKRS